MSNLQFLKPVTSMNQLVRKKKIERMSVNQIETVIKRNEDLEKELKNNMDHLTKVLKQNEELKVENGQLKINMDSLT